MRVRWRLHPSPRHLPQGERERICHFNLSKSITRKDLKAEVMEKGALVIGGGVAGIQAALDLANSGVKVYLIERSPSLGGRMAQLDKTFPTMDCAI